MEFEEIYTTYFRDVYMYILRLSNDEHLAEEITSETFFKAVEAIDSFRGECDVRVWLCQIAKNCYYRHRKTARRTDSIHGLEIADPDLSLEDRLSHNDEAELIQQILHDIPDPYKEVFMWRVFAELSFKQIGRMFSKSENWACVTYHRAKSKIIERLEGKCREK